MTPEELAAMRAVSEKLIAVGDELSIAIACIVNAAINHIDAQASEIERLRLAYDTLRTSFLELNVLSGKKNIRIRGQAARIQELEASLTEAEALIRKNADMINGYLARIAKLESQLAEYRKPVESMDTDQLSQWNVELSTLLCMPVSDRENLWWQIAVGDHLDKFAKSWHSSRITELENSLDEAEALIKKNAALMNGYLARIAELDAQILHQTAILQAEIAERERLQAQIAALQEIAVEIYAREIYPFNMPIWEHLPEEDTWVDDKLFGKSKRTGKSTYRYHARDQLAKEHPEAFGYIAAVREEAKR